MIRILLIVLAWAACTATPASAQETRYISDQLFVPLRSGQGNQYRIIHRGLPSGTSVKFIEQSEDGEWSLVEVRNGEQGWIRNQYLLEEPTAGVKLARTEAEMAKLRKDYENLQNDYRALSGDKSSALNNISSLTAQRDQLAEELANIKQLSANAIDLNERYQALLEKHQMLQTEADILKASNQRLENDKVHNHWIYGASILGVGMLFTLIIQGFSGRKRKSEWIS
ncbi:TIGR04211 family SH3 domain-containing protein [Simiduia sp. 21SJ11W-1]|uniref:TIGR04211 family SH3 domain-containing protein n=1 Tax=Simiduia sp. 21SJ11W-1 TaxID=2909669 RepID=UPI0020A17F36|nr:TIGR04211 family SH3 domain-containing protein [Simiduia sp. 21SJ11W-1]UTA49298.1 TIGR04211 family SH3 domain-containing protein [Simiduia sp. 21SJ11W-1]